MFRENRPVMKASAIVLAAALAGLPPAALAAAAQESEVNSRFIDVRGRISSINDELSTQRATLGTLRAQANSQEKTNREIMNELKALRRQNQALIDSLFSSGGPGADGRVAEASPIRNYDLQTPDGKLYLGDSEFVYIEEANAVIDARIDSGAAVSSICALNVTEFERGKSKWARFDIVANDRVIPMEAQVLRRIEVMQAGTPKPLSRLVVRLNMKIGDYSSRSEFTLADRTRMQYAIIIGRTMLKDIAVVDVSRDHIQGQPELKGPALTILSKDGYALAQQRGDNPNLKYDQAHRTAGLTARPQETYGQNLGTNSELALPEVRQSRSGGN